MKILELRVSAEMHDRCAVSRGRARDRNSRDWALDETCCAFEGQMENK